MNYNRDEQETIMSFDEMEKVWYIETNCTRHITKYLKLNHEIDVIDTDVNDRPTMIRFKVPMNNVTVRNLPSEKTAEEKERLRLLAIENFHKK